VFTPLGCEHALSARNIIFFRFNTSQGGVHSIFQVTVYLPEERKESKDKIKRKEEKDKKKK
jgi:hypothetical protein